MILQKNYGSSKNYSSSKNYGSSKKLEKNIKQIHVWDWLRESYFTKNCKELEIFLKEENIKKQGDPLKSLQL